MNRIKLSREIRNVREAGCIEKYFLFSASSIIAGIKPAALFSLPEECYKQWAVHNERLCLETDIFAVELYRCEKTVFVLLYDSDLLAASLGDSSVRYVLDLYDYPDTSDVKELLAHLRERCCVHRSKAAEKGAGGKEPFPHEIGIFLGYPPKDVHAFIEKEGRDYLHCSHWKVYHDVVSAMDTFRKIDSVRAYALNLISRSYSVSRTVELISQHAV